MTDETTGAEPEAEADAEEVPQFENRAARRAKGKGKSGHVDQHSGHLHGRSGTVTGPRQYGNRRSG
jgi:hypothetical protein